ncbi:MprA protease, GlyGly-CTERM protein-sorting domain-containing form [Ralstonia insidiosa]|uniref:MprA protease, GlyGly-CTERM protein-sorting domain-containing form n=1 Tax=Ralstonia insidiosa TaxID=190721 RepID=A0A191ZZL5_9RALS|nr:MprA protease, GlyGly-CTERM protein-sorting domain-containing form [Ralstonia insidiosa]ANJ73491.1 MprA protease, GlyGly-CTERM protein-sorting domain-containing form [Ralstonia insidiosa]KAB0473868.1 MprA protease, GlyGly-CTERM protein-sorting domain-containing form [Ralstonia insidiosa]MBY4912185.1 MprA protease, GlyGly-CTERM protein-sorting domain-containing form [Ralstonia insidiosa]
MTHPSFRLKSWLRAGASVAGIAWLMGGPPAVAATPQPQYTGDLIIKWRDDTSGTRKTLSAAESGNRLLSVAQTAGSTLQVKRTLGTQAQLMHTGLTDATSIEATAAKIAQDGRVAYVVPDRILRPNTIPNDPLFATQNNLASPTLVPGGINAAAAWSITQGSSSIVVAVVDTGYTDHPDLSGKILPGYNFISDPARAGNTTGRGTDAHDLGDIVTAADVPNISGCTTSDISNPAKSSWHGTEVSSVLAANTNNALDIAGVGWNTRIVPVRVSGKCGALLSDTVDGMLWAGGIAVSGVPTNANPARVVNVSLGSTGACSAAEQDAVNRLASIGTTVVAASGNEAAQNADAPANCTGAIAVTAHVDSGENASYANVGSQVALSAPGGGCANSQATSSGCTGTTSVIQADSNDGAQTLGNYVVKSVAGTSFSTPEVAGTIALMLSVQPQLSNAQILAGLQQTARPHPSGTYCAVNTGVCGAGLLDTAGAVGYAQRTTPAGIGNGTASSGSTGGTSGSSSSGGGGGAVPLAGAALMLALGLACRRKRSAPQ